MNTLPFPIEAPIRRPAKIITVGSASVQVFGRGPYTIAWRECAGGRRNRAMRTDWAKAKKFAEGIARDLANGQQAMIGFTETDRASYKRALELLQGIGEQLEPAVGNYAQCVQTLGGRVSVLEACRDWLARHPADVEQKTIPKIVEEYLAKRAICTKYRRNLEKVLERFASRFDCPFAAVQTKHVEDWLDSLRSTKGKNEKPIGLRTRRNHLDAVKAVAAYAQSRRYVDRDWNILASVEDPEPAPAEVKIYTPEDLERLLAKAESYKAGKKLVPLVAITAFAGVRHGEMNEEKIEHLDWAHFDWEAKRIYIDSGAAKQTHRSKGDDRIVDMPDNLVAWLQPYRRPSGKICSLSNSADALCRLIKKTGISGPRKNALRKSFITYKLARTQNIEGVADQAGNSPGIIRKHYKAAGHTRLREVADRWFSIMPVRADVLPLWQCAAKLS